MLARMSQSRCFAMLQVYDRSQEWTDENRTCPSTPTPNAVQDAKEVRALYVIIFCVFFIQYLK